MRVLFYYLSATQCCLYMECSLPLHIGAKVTIKNYNTFLRHYGSSGYKFRFQLNNDDCTGEVDIIGMASTVHEDVVSRL